MTAPNLFSEHTISFAQVHVNMFLTPGATTETAVHFQLSHTPPLQHMRAHKNPTALKYTFSQVIRYNQTLNDTDRGLSSLQQHCLSPGEYHKHLQL